jgi:tetratricopeptide (TPR) repeat protein
VSSQSPTKGMLSQKAARKSLMATLIDLYKSDLAFRGMLDFAVIGFLTMMFLHPPHLTGRSPEVPPKPFDFGDNSKPTPGSTVPIQFPPNIRDAKLADAFTFDFDTKIFGNSTGEDQKRLEAARISIALSDSDKAIADLRGGSDTDANVWLLRGAAEMTRFSEAGRRAAETYWRQAVTGGSTPAKALLGQLLGSGLSGVTENKAEALQLIEAGIAAEDRQAMRIGATAFLSGELGVLDPPRAADLLRRSAGAGDAMAMALYARTLHDGLGVAKADPDAAANYLDKAANAGYTPAQYALGQWQLDRFLKGLTPDPKSGIAWLTRAYEKGRALSGLTTLAGFYDTAPSGLKNLPLAADYVRRCSAFQFCQIYVGYAWQQGYFGKVDLVAARAHTALSVGYYPNAMAQLSEIDAKLTPAQRSEAAALEQKIRVGIVPAPDEIHIQYPDMPAIKPLEAIWPGIPVVPQTGISGGGGGGSGNVAPEKDALHARIQKHLDDKDYDSALADLTDIIRQGNATWEDYYLRGSAHDAKGQTDLAIEDFDRAISRNPSVASPYFNRSMARLGKDDEAGAFADINTAITLEPASRLYYFARGNLNFRKGDYRAAIADYDRFMDLAGSAETGEKLLNLVARGKSKLYLAINEGDACKAMIPPSPSCTPATKFEPAVKDLQEALAIDPNDANANVLMALVADKSGDKRRAIDFYTYALKANPNDTTAYNNRGVIYADMGQQNLAMADYNEAIRCDPNNAWAWANRGITNAALRNRKQAIADLRQALAIDPNHQFARQTLRSLGVRN